MDDNELRLFAHRMQEDQLRKKKNATEAFLINNSNRVIVLKSQDLHLLHGKGRFRIAYFLFPPPDKNYYGMIGFRKAISNRVFCFVMDNKVNDLNTNWTDALRHDFNPRKTIDYQRMQKWYENMKKHGFQISAFYCAE